MVQPQYFLGEIGDAFKFVITKKDIIKTFLDHLARNTKKDIKLTCSLFSLKLNDYTRGVNNYFRKTISEVYDINTESITKAFRVENNKPPINKDKPYKLIALLDKDSIDVKNKKEEDYIDIPCGKENKTDKQPKKMYPLVYIDNNKTIEGQKAKEEYFSLPA